MFLNVVLRCNLFLVFCDICFLCINWQWWRIRTHQNDVTTVYHSNQNLNFSKHFKFFWKPSNPSKFTNPSTLKTLKTPVLIYTPPLFRLKLVYSYVIEVADSEYQLLFRRRPLVSAIFIFPWIRVTYNTYEFNDLFCTTIRENASLNTPST